MAFDEGGETQLIDSAIAGDADAFSELFERYYTMIHAFAWRLCLDSEDARDVAQETFVKAARSLGSFHRRGSFKQWIYRIALNSARDRNRSQLRRARAIEMFAGEVSPVDYSEVHRALAALPSDLRQAVTLVYLEGMSHAEAGKILFCAEATVSWRIYMAKGKLKRLLGGKA